MAILRAVALGSTKLILQLPVVLLMCLQQHREAPAVGQGMIQMIIKMGASSRGPTKLRRAPQLPGTRQISLLLRARTLVGLGLPALYTSRL
jgi:hypothetical protein